MNGAEDAYTVDSLDVGDLTEAERARCLQLISDGGAVTTATARRDFPRSKIIAVARKYGEVVGVASIKPIREDYAVGRAAKAKHRFDPETPELGYVVVDPPHRGHRLSSRMAEALTRDGGALFATTSDPQMQAALRGAGFVEQGNAWKGRRGDMISLWIKES